jgi:hypothetical protein
MYDRKSWCEALAKDLQDNDEDGILVGKYVPLLRVELGLRLLERLNFVDEPITVLWVLLSCIPIPDNRLDALSEQQRHALANARILLPFSGRFNWENALREYADITESWRCYQVLPQDFDKQMVYRPDLQRYQERIIAYDAVLDSTLPFAQRTIQPATAATFCYDARTEQGQRTVTIDLPQEFAELAATSISWFTQPRPHTSLSFKHSDFRDIAEELERLRQQRGLQNVLGSTQSWVELVDNLIGYRAIQADGSLSDRNTVPLLLDGYANIVGAVASGKSTIMKFIAAYAVLHPEKDLRITLVVGDTMSALDLADEFNRLFCNCGEQPVAVPLLGRTTRDLHLRRLYRSGKFRPDHWALRWFNVACPIQSLADAGSLPVIPGKEPCESLYKPLKTPKARKVYQYCPLFAVCPGKQLYRDMPGARVWITTPGALGGSSVPAQAEQRKLHVSELVYEQSDAVIFDEAETVQEWFDSLFAAEVKLTNGVDGLLDVEDVETAQAWVPKRTQPPPARRWVGAERHSLSAISNILSNLTDIERGVLLRRWVGRSYFTSLSLAYKLAWRLLGLPKWEECQGQERMSADQKVRRIVRYFDRLSLIDPLTMERPRKAPDRDPIYRLALIMRVLIAAGDSAHNTAVNVECKAWIEDFIPDIQKILKQLERQRATWQARLNQRNTPIEEPPDDLDTLAQRLEFVLSVMILDRNIRVVFYEWYNKPDNMLTDLNEHSLERSPSSLTDVLPVPPTGRMFGTYYSKGLEIGQSEQKNRSAPSGLSVFGYPNIGRWFIMHFHELFTVLDGRRGPNVLALSGTSWLPHSSSLHIDIHPQGILDPSPQAGKAIAKSTFTFLPQFVIDNKTGRTPIRISGITEKLQPIKDIINELANDRGKTLAPLKEDLEWLQKLAQQEPESWQDRERLLLIVNSYEQAKWAYEALRERWSSVAAREICYLIRSETGEDELDTDESVYRSDIEDFAQTGGKILIAPLQAIGRGYNILNKNGKAAFGAIYFLTRPMPYPADTQSMAQELNRRTLDWCKDDQFEAWKVPGLYDKALLLRKKANEYWRKAELRSFYRYLEHDDKDTKYSERYDLAATTAGHIIQACGRLIRGGVPFHAYFVDSAWAPGNAQDRKLEETPKTSLLAAIIQVMQEEYIQTDIGKALYAPIVEALLDIRDFLYKY